MQQTQTVFVGVDVAKSTLCAVIHDSNIRQELANDREVIRQWIDRLPADAMIAVESTGRYHEQLVRLADESGRTVFVLNARDVFFYAKALGARGKADRSDAQVIARYLAEHHGELKPWSPPTSVQARVQELLRCRAGIAAKRSALRQVLREVEGLESQRAQLDEAFDELFDRIDAEIEELLESDEQLGRHAQALRTIPGIGLQSSAMLVTLLSRIPFANADAVVAYSGLDPRPNDSGERHGKRRISKRGSPALRRLLYLSACAAARSKLLRPLYQSIKARGFRPTQALIILARKLLRIAWAVWRTGTPFDVSRLSLPGACAKS